MEGNQELYRQELIEQERKANKNTYTDVAFAEIYREPMRPVESMG